MDLIAQIEAEQIAALGNELPDFKAGDTLRVGYKVTEGTRSRVQNYEGVCIARKGGAGIAGGGRRRPAPVACRSAHLDVFAGDRRHWYSAGPAASGGSAGSGGGAGGPPNIADFDGDGIPDIGTAGGNNYAVELHRGRPASVGRPRDGMSRYR